MGKEDIEIENIKARDSRAVEKILKIAEKDPEIALNYIEKLRDREAKIYGLVNIYNITGNENTLLEACKIAVSDDERLKIVEYSRYHPLVGEVAEMIESGYKRDVAFSLLLERTGDLNYAYRIKDPRILSASLKRLSARRMYPENLRVARMIPEPYYRCLALLDVLKKEGDVEGVKKEIEVCATALRYHLRRRILEALEKLE